jgi:hypothetical protein
VIRVNMQVQHRALDLCHFHEHISSTHPFLISRSVRLAYLVMNHRRPATFPHRKLARFHPLLRWPALHSMPDDEDW